MSVIERLDQRLRNMSTMLTRFGIDPVEFAKQDYCNQFVASIRNCQFCPHGDRCSEWLAAADDKIREIPSFCPNKSKFERIRATAAFS